jgi:hypothetical protein
MKTAVQEIIDAIGVEIDWHSSPEEFHEFEERCITRGLTIARDHALRIRDKHFYPRLEVSWEPRKDEYPGD